MLTLKDLSASRELDREAMSELRGGTSKMKMPALYIPSWTASSLDIDFNAVQNLAQAQNVLVNNGNNVAFSAGITANVQSQQNGQNVINFG